MSSLLPDCCEVGVFGGESGKESKVNAARAQRRGRGRLVSCVEVEVEGRGTVILQHTPAR